MNKSTAIAMNQLADLSAGATNVIGGRREEQEHIIRMEMLEPGRVYVTTTKGLYRLKDDVLTRISFPV